MSERVRPVTALEHLPYGTAHSSKQFRHADYDISGANARHLVLVLQAHVVQGERMSVKGLQKPRHQRWYKVRPHTYRGAC